MAVVFESLSLKGLRRTHLEQLLWYVNQQERRGDYYGNHEQFIKRQDDLIVWLGKAVENANADGVVFPKAQNTG